MTDPELMRRAVALARESVAAGGGPFGAVIVADGEVLATGTNRVVADGDPSAHAEIVAIRSACELRGSHDLTGCEIYASCEPCPMCLGAILWARIERVHYACTRDDATRAGFDDARLYDEISAPPEDRSVPMVQALRDEALPAFRDWEEKPDRVPY